MLSARKRIAARQWYRHLITAVVLGLSTSAIQADEQPAALEVLVQQGAEIGASFDAPGGMTGYLMRMRGQSMTVFVTPDGKHAVVGTMIDAQGRNLSRERIEQAQNEPHDEEVWSRLTDSRWIADGDEEAERVVYVFTDPNCPYCHGFWESARPWVEAGDVQLRHVMVGVIKQDSAAKSATLLAAEEPGEALTAHENAFNSGGVTPADDIPDETRRAVERNNSLMSELGFSATPTIVYRDEDGEIRHKRGQPRGDDLPAVMGGPQP